MKKIVAFIFICFVCSCTIQAQSYQEIHAGTRLGLSNLHVSVKEGHRATKMNAGFTLKYIYFFTKRWGVVSGFESGSYQYSVSIPEIKGREDGQDLLFPGEHYRLHYEGQLYEESGTIKAFTIPVMLQCDLSEKTYIALGGKFTIPYHSTASIQAASLETRGYFSYEDRTYTGVEYGFYQSRDFRKKIDPRLGLGCLLSVELGMKYKFLTPTSYLSLSVFADYGLNNIQKERNTPLVQYQQQGPEYLSHNSITSSEFSSKSFPVAIGITLRLGFGWKK